MSSNDQNTAKLVATPITRGGFPNVVDDYFKNAINQAKAGGDALQSFYDAMNQTSDFWGWLAENAGDNLNPFAPGHDPDGNPIMMGSSGNVDMRYGAFYRGDTDAAKAEDDETPVVGVATIQTGNTTTRASKTLSFALSVAGLPPGILLTKALFGDLLSPLYANMKTWITKNASDIQEAAQVEDPDVDPEDAADDALSDASGEVEDVGGELAEEGVEYATINWGAGALEVAGMGALAAVPMIVSFLGHNMVTSVMIVNETDYDFTWNIAYQDAGKTSVSPKSDDGKVIPKMDYYTDIWGDKTSVKCAYEANFQFINSSDLGSIGNLITLTPSGGATSVANLLVSVPWSGDNTVWVGPSSGNAQSTYEAHSAPNDQLSVSSTFDQYKVTVAITKLRGETKGQYFYGVLVHIEPNS
ncbi:hypothetical protein BLA50215_00833 [Burkholderia lata]|uniref:hypothetical protein n=1 Tax=Burkholderia lata (strain ATCC 17760 / DSM 23089 / LMG 22485 / NCIMB 9086 / R18194 / 383) TaxID=482957 RepID=UPI001453DEDC|nr:hypothetical protein [Burkholderia lata]VWC74835.1 hypothetical protein BLA50215_00833 [Burkholderia lata]